MKVMIVGTPTCAFCKEAIELCKRENIQYEYKTLNEDIQLDKLFEMCGGPVRTVPQIFVTSGGFTEYIGGYDKLQEKLKQNKGL